MKRKFIKKIKTLNKKVLSTLMGIGILITSLGMPPYLEVGAVDNTQLFFDLPEGSMHTISINPNDATRIQVFNEENLVGDISVKKIGAATPLTPTCSNGCTYDLGSANSENVEVTLTPSLNYRLPNTYNFGGNDMPLSNSHFDLTLTGGIISDLKLDFEENVSPNNTVLNVAKPSSTIVSTDADMVIYKIGDKKIASLKVKVGDSYIIPALGPNGSTNFALTKYTDASYSAIAEFTLEPGYDLDNFYHIDGTQHDTPGDRKLPININDNKMFGLEFNFIEGEIPSYYPIVAYFSDIEEGAGQADNGYIIIPENWNNGTITFKAKVCDLNGKIVPNSGEYTCTNPREINTRIEGVINGDELNNTISGSHTSITVKDGFNDYGRILLHITKEKESDPNINSFITVARENMISITANSPLTMSQSFGSVTANTAIVTKDVTKDIKIFFGNNSTTLIAGGENVDKITDVKGNIKDLELNFDGTATFSLPALSLETTTKVEVTILLLDGKSIKRNINIVRTAILLQHTYGDDDDTVYAGYVANKSYLYNNQAHNDDVFDAYLQVVLYKDDIVMGYKQVKIEDKDLVNGLHDDESGSLEIYSENQIPLYGTATEDLIEGVNKVSVFLTNGEIDFSGETLPSVEFGIGSGVTLEWGAIDEED